MTADSALPKLTGADEGDSRPVTPQGTKADEIEDQQLTVAGA
jgi:hypothetical protein